MTNEKKKSVPEDLKEWYALSCPIQGLRFDAGTLAFLDADGDGRIRSDEVKAALAFLREKGVSMEDLVRDHAEEKKALDENLARQAELEKSEPTPDEKAALAAWEAAEKDVLCCGEATAEAEAALAAVEAIVDAYFTPADDVPLVTEGPDKILPLRTHLNPKHVVEVVAFGEKCVRPLMGERESLTRLDWKAVKDAFAPFRAWRASKPVLHEATKKSLREEEKRLRYTIFLGEFLENYVTMSRLRDGQALSMFQTGVLRIDGKELHLCFHVEDEAAHAALSGKSECCVIYLKLRRPSAGATRNICAVVTAGTIGGLYAGRNGVFFDRDGGNWEAVITKVVESQVSLTEAFWAPWKKLGSGIADAVKKFLGDRQAKSVANVQKGTQSAQAGGAALASSVAAIGIGVGMVGAALASLAAAVRGMTLTQFFVALVAVVLVVSLPSVILTWFKLRRRDLGAILNASGWAINRRIGFSMARARSFTRCAKTSDALLYGFLILLVLALLGGAAFRLYAARSRASEARACAVAQPQPATEAANAPAAPSEEQS